MDFVDLETAEESLDNQPLIFLEDEEMTNHEMDGFILKQLLLAWPIVDCWDMLGQIFCDVDG